MLQGFFLPFFTILVAEMLDKSQLAIVALSGKTKNYLALFLGSMLAFILVDGAAIVFGAIVAELVPQNLVSLFAGLVFIFFGVLSLRPEKESDTKKIKKSSVFVSAFLLIFLSEWADKTQLAAAAFASYLNPVLVFLGTISALAILTLLAIFVGSKLTKYIKRELLQKITGALFLLIGAFLLFSALS